MPRTNGSTIFNTYDRFTALRLLCAGRYAAESRMRYPVTPDGRYFVVRGRLWRCTNPALPETERERLVRELMRHRAAIGRARRVNDEQAEAEARRRVHESKVALGERGAVWWRDGAPDYNRRMAKNTPYADWYAALGKDDDARKPG